MEPLLHSVRMGRFLTHVCMGPRGRLEVCPVERLSGFAEAVEWALTATAEDPRHCSHLAFF